MAVNSVSGASGVSSKQLEEASTTVSNELGKDAFLKLLIAELANQDPLNPMDDREFIAQMAQFTSLEQMTNMTKAIEGMAEMEQFSAVSYVGKWISFDYTDPETKETTEVVDFVDSVWYDPKEGPMLKTMEYKKYGIIPLKSINGVSIGVVEEA